MDFDEYSLCRPPSPCDVEFENANIVIDGKSSIRQKPKESTVRKGIEDLGLETSINEWRNFKGPTMGYGIGGYTKKSIDSR